VDGTGSFGNCTVTFSLFATGSVPPFVLASTFTVWGYDDETGVLEAGHLTLASSMRCPGDPHTYVALRTNLRPYPFIVNGSVEEVEFRDPYITGRLTRSGRSVSIGDAIVQEGGPNTGGLLEFTVSLSAPAPSGGVSVNFGVSDGTANAVSDYNVNTGTLSFASGEQSKTITVTVIGDTIAEPDETVIVTLSGANGVTIADGTAVGYIHDDDSLDTDGDALLDTWEKDGLDIDGDGTVDLDLPAMGADPMHKDIFVEIDSMQGHALSQDAIDVVVRAFAAAPVPNPDGASGIRLHVDNGSGSIMNPASGATWGSLSRANVLPHQEVLGSSIGGAYQWSEFDLIKAVNFAAARRPVFHYAVSADRVGTDGGSVSGTARGAPASDFIVSLGLVPEPREGPRWLRLQAGTFMHELGHDLGLEHGGRDLINYKPNYLSVMNYALQFSGLPREDGTFILDYSRYLISLDESRLDEDNGFGYAPGSDVARFIALGYCAAGGEFAGDVFPVPLLSGPVDWNCDATMSGVVATDVNKDAVVTVLDGFVDWPNLVFDGGAIGDLGDVILPAVTEMNEPPITELLEAERNIRAAMDSEPPVLMLPGTVAVDATTPAGAVVIYSASATDNLDQDPTVSCTPASGSTFPIGSTTVNCSATDDAGNVANGTFIVQVRGASELIQALATKTDRFVDLPQFALPLQLWLQVAARALPGRPAEACRALEQYSQVAGNAPLRLLTVAEKAELLADAQRIRGVIPCSPPQNGGGPCRKMCGDIPFGTWPPDFRKPVRR
jgi:Calx-beta domain/HYR domain